MRISDWSSDVCSSDLLEARHASAHGRRVGARDGGEVRNIKLRVLVTRPARNTDALVEQLLLELNEGCPSLVDHLGNPEPVRLRQLLERLVAQVIDARDKLKPGQDHILPGISQLRAIFL